MAFQTEAEAAQLANYTLVRYERDQAAYQCQRCKLWHLAPKKAQLVFLACSYCQGRDGNYKLSYPSEACAEIRGEKIGNATYKRLRPYECPHGDGWHLTSRF